MFTTKKITTLGLFLALGILFPYFTGHAFGIPGTILLPMHIPVIIIGMMYGPITGLILGLLIPFLSAILTGMPGALFMPIMIVELGVYGMISGLLYKKLNQNIYVSLVGAMICGRIGYGLMAYFLVNIFNLAQYAKVVSVFTAVTVGLPGIIIQLIFIPIIVKMLGKLIND